MAAKPPGGLYKFEVDDELRGRREELQKVEPKVRKFFDDSNGAFTGKKAIIMYTNELEHSSASDARPHITVEIWGIKKVGQMEQHVSTYWFCAAEGTYWKDAVHVLLEEPQDRAKSFIEITEELFFLRQDNLKNAGKDTYWLVGNANTDPSFLWPKNTDVPPGLVNAFAGKHYRKVTKEEFATRPPILAVLKK